MRPHEDYWHTAKLVALIIAICLWLILFNMSKFQQMPTGKVLELARCGNGVIESDIGEECEYNNDSFCPGR